MNTIKKLSQAMLLCHMSFSGDAANNALTGTG